MKRTLIIIFGVVALAVSPVALAACGGSGSGSGGSNPQPTGSTGY